MAKIWKFLLWSASQIFQEFFLIFFLILPPQGCVAILSVTWILCLTFFGLLVLPYGEYFWHDDDENYYLNCDCCREQTRGRKQMRFILSGWQCNDFCLPSLDQIARERKYHQLFFRLCLQLDWIAGLWAIFQQGIVSNSCDMCFLLSNNNGPYVLLRIELSCKSISTGDGSTSFDVIVNNVYYAKQPCNHGWEGKRCWERE
jgi:hypothetical protein